MTGKYNTRLITHEEGTLKVDPVQFTYQVAQYVNDVHCLVESKTWEYLTTDVINALIKDAEKELRRRGERVNE